MLFLLACTKPEKDSSLPVDENNEDSASDSQADSGIDSAIDSAPPTLEDVFKNLPTCEPQSTNQGALDLSRFCMDEICLGMNSEEVEPRPG
jgi:hypothetical protein